MGWVLNTAAASEPLTAAEVKTYCRIDASNQEAAPTTALTAALAGAGAGNVDNGAHRYCVTYVTADGETAASPISGAVTVADKTANGKVALTAIPLGGAAVTARKVYRTVAAGTTYLLLTTLSNNTATTYTDNTADSSLGAQAPTANTTADPELLRMIASARQYAETFLGRQLITASWKYYLDEFPESSDTPIWLPVSPALSITSIKYYNGSGVLTTLDAAQYSVDVTQERGRVLPAYGYVWPTARTMMNAVEVIFSAGYGAASSDVPSPIREGMLKLIRHWYDNRGAIIVGTISSEMEWGLAALWNAYRLPGVA